MMLRLLLVDDEASYRSLLGRHLERKGFQVQTAANAHEALALAEHAPPDVLVVDWMLRNSVDGLQLAGELRRQNEHLKTVVMTGYPSEDLQRQVLSNPDTSYLAKPFLLNDLVGAVHRAAQH